MFLLLLFAFLAGIVTILSPCILPILPIILSGTVGGGKKKPLGIVAGFILSFTFFTLFLTTIVQSLGISASVLRSFSIVIILLFGVVLLFPQVLTLTEKLFSSLSKFAPKSSQDTGFFGGMLIGLSLGLLWTPCVGPILASVISLALTGSVNSTAFFITLAYSLGTGIPMLAITYGGRSLFKKIPWLLANTAKIQKGFGVVMILTALGLFFNIDRKFQTYILEIFPQYGTGLTSFEDNSLIRGELDKLNDGMDESDDKTESSLFDSLKIKKQAPEFVPSGDWYNSDPLTLSSLRGKVVLVDFWTYSCINCIRTLPYLRDWNEKYAADGLVIVGVHAPEFEFEKDSKNVAKAIKDFELTYPIFQDNDFLTWRAYDNHYWPAKYLVDKDGNIVYTHFGEGKYDETEKVIQNLLKESGVDVSQTSINSQDYEIKTKTPELYLGSARIEYFASAERIKENSFSTYSFPSNLQTNFFAFNGNWLVSPEFSTPKTGGQLKLRFDAKDVFLVMRPKNGNVGKVKVMLDGNVVNSSNEGEDVRDGKVEINEDRLYKLIHLKDAGEHELLLEFEDDNTEVFAFTFG